MLARMWSRGNTLALLMGVQTCTATLEINIMVFQKIGNHSTSGPSYTTFEHIPKGFLIIPQRHLLKIMFTAALFIIARNTT